MKKLYFCLIISFLLLTNCAREQIVKTHGIAYLEKREKLIKINSSNKNDIISILGLPATKGMTDDNVWIYIERTKTRGKLLKFGKNITSKNNVLVLEFDKYGVLASKDFYGKDKMKKIKFDKDATTFEGKKENFIYSFLSSVRQKMLTKTRNN